MTRSILLSAVPAYMLILTSTCATPIHHNLPAENSNKLYPRDAIADAYPVHFRTPQQAKNENTKIAFGSVVQVMPTDSHPTESLEDAADSFEHQSGHWVDPVVQAKRQKAIEKLMELSKKQHQAPKSEQVQTDSRQGVTERLKEVKKKSHQTSKPEQVQTDSRQNATQKLKELSRKNQQKSSSKQVHTKSRHKGERE